MWKYTIGKIIGVFILVCGTIMFLAMLGNIAQERNEVVDGVLGGTAIGLVPALLGFWIWRSSVNASRKYLVNTHERQILRLAAENGGHLNPTELAMHTDLNLNESRKILELMQQQGYAQLNVSPNGTINFYFSGLDKNDDRKQGELL